MNAIETLRTIAARVDAKLAAINRLTLSQWSSLAAQLEVALNDREHAAKKLALRELRSEGVIA